MIDPENEVYTRVATAVRGAYPKADLSGEYVKSPSAFPHVSLEMSDSYPDTRRLDSGGKENMTVALFTVNIYSNRKTGKKTECKKIAALIDAVLYGLNATRTALTPVPNLEDATIYRMTARYQLVTDGKNFYRR